MKKITATLILLSLLCSVNSVFAQAIFGASGEAIANQTRIFLAPTSGKQKIIPTTVLNKEKKMIELTFKANSSEFGKIVYNDFSIVHLSFEHRNLSDYLNRTIPESSLDKVLGFKFITKKRNVSEKLKDE